MQDQAGCIDEIRLLHLSGVGRFLALVGSLYNS
jgi:hypothetical protein